MNNDSLYYYLQNASSLNELGYYETEEYLITNKQTSIILPEVIYGTNN